MEIINTTKSLCPRCLKIIEAQVVERGDRVYICKTCPAHGYFEDTHPLGNSAHYRPMAELFKNHSPLAHPDGLVINLTSRCNLDCPFCFARANEYEASQPSLDQIREKITGFLGSTVYLSGGEPTLRTDLCEIIREIKKLGYQAALFTNGKQLLERNFIRQLKQSGLNLVILQFDTFDEQQCEFIRGERLVETKLNVLKKLKQAKIPVYLFSMLVKEVNTDQVEKLIEFTVANSSYIKILNLNPVWEMGRVGKHLPMNMSEIAGLVEEKTGIKSEDFIAGTAFSYYVFSIYRQISKKGGNRHPWCEMRAYIFSDGGRGISLGEILDIKKLNASLRIINQRLRESPGFELIKLLIWLPYGLLLKEFLLKKKFRQLVYRTLKRWLAGIIFFRKLSFMDLGAVSIIVGTFHTASNIDLNLVATCNLYSDSPDGQYRSSCLRQISIMSNFEADTRVK